MNTLSANTPSTVKAHIPRLPTVPYRVPDTETDTRLAVSIPLFHSDFQWVDGGIAKERFQQVHCRGAIWAALSLLWNTDLGENGVRVYFHIEARLWDIALPVFRAFGVPGDWLRPMALPDAKAKGAAVENVHYGKKFMALIDTAITPDVWCIADSDAFVCVAGSPLHWHDTLTSGLFLKHPAVYDFRLEHRTYQHWTHRCCDAVGIPYDPEKSTFAQEKAAFAKVGLTYPSRKEKGLRTAKTVLRPVSKNVLMTLPRRHPLTRFAKTHFQQCYEDEFLLAMFAMTGCPLLNLQATLEVPMFLTKDEYLDFICQQTDVAGYIHHHIFDSRTDTRDAGDCDAYFNRFYRDVTRHIAVPTPFLDAWRALSNL